VGVSLHWPVGSTLHADAFAALLGEAFSRGPTCRVASRSDRSEGGIWRRMEFSCGDRRLTSVVGEWPSGPTATITLE
jgi:hypothetical protein